MNKLISTSCFLLMPAVALFAQGPRGGGGPMGGRGMGMMGGPQQVVSGAPYSAVEVVQTQETLADGNTIVHKLQSNVYRDSQGRDRTEETITPLPGKAAVHADHNSGLCRWPSLSARFVDDDGL